jgi:hypothetical protein
MNNVTRLAPPALAPLRRRASLQRLLTVAVIGLALPLLAACSSDPGSTGSSGSSRPTVTPRTATPTTSAAADPATSPTIAANGDPFCDLAVKAQTDQRQLDSTTSEFTTLLTSVVSGTAPVADLNAWGSTLYALAESSTTFYGDAAPYVAGTDAAADFVAMKGFVTAYSMPLAAMARDASDGKTFMTEVGTFVQTSEVKAAITTAPAAAQRVAAYIANRCPAAG